MMLPLNGAWQYLVACFLAEFEYKTSILPAGDFKQELQIEEDKHQKELLQNKELIL